MQSNNFNITQSKITNALMTAVLALSAYIYNGLNNRWDKTDDKLDQALQNQAIININIEVLKNRIDYIEKIQNIGLDKKNPKSSSLLLYKPEEEIKLKVPKNGPNKTI